MNQSTKIVWVVVIGIILIAGVWYYLASRDDNTGSDQVVCTMDAKLCPDGSYVGRVGPRCEFSPCPSGSATSTQGTTTGMTGVSLSSESALVSPADIYK